MGALRRRAPNKPTLATNNMNAHTATNPLESPVAGNVDCTDVAGTAAVVTGTAAVVTGTAAVVTGTAAVVTGTAAVGAVVVVTGADGRITFVIVNDRTTSVALV